MRSSQGRFRLGIGVGAALDDMRHPRAEFPSDLAQARLTALILHGVMQKRGDGFVLVAAMGEHGGGHAQKMRDVRPRGSFAELGCVQPRRVS